MKLHSLFVFAVMGLLPALCGGCPCCSAVASGGGCGAVLGAGSRTATTEEAKAIDRVRPFGRPQTTVDAK